MTILSIFLHRPSKIIFSVFYNSGHAFPACFSERDANFLRKEIEEVFKAGKHAVEEINKSNPQAAFAFTLFECIEGKSLASERELSFEMSRCPAYIVDNEGQD